MQNNPQELVVTKHQNHRKVVEAFDTVHRFKTPSGASFDDEILEVSQFDRIPAYEHLISEGLELGLTLEQIKFAAFMAVPRCLRPTQQVLATLFKVERLTLWRWKGVNGFNIIRVKLARSYFADDVTDIIKMQREKALTGDSVAARMILEMNDALGSDAEKGNTVNNLNVYVTEKEAKSMINDLRGMEAKDEQLLPKEEANEKQLLPPIPEGLDY